MEIPCSHCGRFFTPSSRHKNQIYCLRSPCRRARKAAWQREKMHTDPDYRANQRTSQATWAARNPGYWKQYRKREILTKRNEIGFCKPSGTEKPEHSTTVKMDSSNLIAKMDASLRSSFR
jgi:hypothetical protein